MVFGCDDGDDVPLTLPDCVCFSMPREKLVAPERHKTPGGSLLTNTAR